MKNSTRHWPEQEGLEARATTVAAAVAAGVVVAGVAGSAMQAEAAEDAANAQVGSSSASVLEQRRQFDATQKLLAPYVNAGNGALVGQQDLAGLNGNDAQAAAIRSLQGSPQFNSMLQQGENSILANASATGGLRGGNTQSALAQFSPALLAATINDQYNRLGGLSSMGLGAATQTGAFGQASTNNVTSLLQQQGAAVAGGQLAQGQANANMMNSFVQGAGAYYGIKNGIFGSGGGGNGGGSGGKF